LHRSLPRSTMVILHVLHSSETKGVVWWVCTHWTQVLWNFRNTTIPAYHCRHQSSVYAG